MLQRVFWAQSKTTFTDTDRWPSSTLRFPCWNPRILRNDQLLHDGLIQLLYGCEGQKVKRSEGPDFEPLGSKILRCCLTKGNPEGDLIGYDALLLICHTHFSLWISSMKGTKSWPRTITATGTCRWPPADESKFTPFRPVTYHRMASHVWFD